MKFYCEKIINLRDADIHLHYANNFGRGSDNVTVTIVEPGELRSARTHQYSSFYEQYRTCGWRGIVSIPNYIIDKNLI